MFEPLPARFDFPAVELRVLDFWTKHDVFGKSLEIRREAPRFVFYEGPPTANGLPHPGHCLTRAIKDLFPRYKTMCGHLVERKAGWDTHGLPVEVEVCKQLGIHTKEEIEQYGLEGFVQKCIESVFRYTQEWEEMTRRLGFWVNLEEAYVTYHQSYVESVWWGLKTLFERGLLYQGHKVVWWWAQGGTALSAGEVGEGYRTVDDPSIYIRFPLVGGNQATRQPGNEGEGEAPAEPPHARLPDDAKVSLLVWTTTPWTLISNHFAAVHPELEYSLIHDKTTDEYLYIARPLVETIAEKVKHEFETVGKCMGSDMVGWRYVPPYRECFYDMVATTRYGFSRQDHRTLAELTRPLASTSVRKRKEHQTVLQQRWNVGQTDHVYVGWRIVEADFVTLDTGTGIVHIAPAFGEVDYDLWRTESDRILNGLELLCAVEPNGTFSQVAPPKYRCRFIVDCDKEIIRELLQRGALFHEELHSHQYPFCPRAEDDKLIQYARKSWFVRTSQFKDEFLKNNDGIYWLPGHIREGRFGDFLRNNVDWALSRERYWGTPLPIWVCEKTGQMEALGSYAELLAKPGVQGTEVWEQAKAGKPDLPEHLKVHKPYIDAITYDSPFTPGRAGVPPARMRRVPEVIDCWWDAGSMPFAQWGFPHTEGSIRTFAERFPCDFISEAIDQTRGWFYGLLAISTLLFSPRAGRAGVPPASVPPASSPAGSTGRGVAPSDITADLSIRRRRRLPHWEAGGSTYFVTFRLAAGELSNDERALVLDACQHWDGQRILLHTAIVMPDHVHLLFTPLEKSPGVWWPLSDLMHSIKGFSAKEINKLRSRTGKVWQDEYFDRIIRKQSDFDEKWEYIVTNPERSGLADNYPWIWIEPTHAEDSGGRDVEEGGRDARPTRTDYPHPYKSCIVLGHVMGEDGLKMSKRIKNYKEPSYIFDHYGADAMRWYFYSAQTPWTSVRFQEVAIRDAQREFLLRLYNVFSFFNIYANIDGFDPGRQPGNEAQRHKGEDATGYKPVPQRSELDRWIISELNRTVQAVRSHLDRFENYPAAGRLKEFVDALSNWYVRRSRNRFWKPVAGSAGVSPANQDKWDAYNTLYEVLVTLAKVLAPFTPFLAETLYQNLVRSDEDSSAGPPNPEPISVHLCDYPEADESLIDEKLAQEMSLVRQIVSLGRAARTEAKLKVRQPLALIEIILARREHAEWLQAHSELIAEELNIKAVEFSTEADQYVTYQLKPEFKALGPKFGKLAPKIAAALGQADPAAARQSLTTTGELVLEVKGQRIHLTGHEVHVLLKARSGWSAAQGRAGVVVVKTELTPELKEEGLIRELIHHVQGLRREQDLAYEARIILYVQGSDELLDVIRRNTDTVQHECLAEKIEYAEVPAGEMLSAKVESYEVRLGIVKV